VSDKSVGYRPLLPLGCAACRCGSWCRRDNTGALQRQVVADLLSKVFSVAMAQNGVLHVASLRRMKELSALSSPRHSFVPRRHRRATADDSASDEVATAPVADEHSAASDTASVAARAERAHEHTLARAKED